MRKIKVAAMGIEHRHIFGQLNDLKSICSEISEISYAGYVLDAERELVEIGLNLGTST